MERSAESAEGSTADAGHLAPPPGLDERGTDPSLSESGPGPAAGESAVAVDEQLDVAIEFLEGLVDAFGLPAEVEVSEEEGITFVDVWGDEENDAALLIGKHGHTLDALQDLVRVVVQTATGDRCAVQVDVEDYRKRRIASAVRTARSAIRKVLETGRPETLPPMSSLERKLVHDLVGAEDELASESVGAEPQRRVVIRRA